MCLAVLSYRQHTSYRLVLAANRDEHYQRPTSRAAFWDDQPDILAGRDLIGGGTWLGVTRSGRFAAVTNFREPTPNSATASSRGLLVADWLRSRQTPEQFLGDMDAQAQAYNGFNLLIGDADSLFYCSNRGPAPRALAPGLYGLSNHLLDTPWPKVTRIKQAMQSVLESDRVDPEYLFDLLADDRQASDDQLPDTGVGLETERMLSPAFIRDPEYGTVGSTVVTIEHSGRVEFIERTFDENGVVKPDARFSFQIE